MALSGSGICDGVGLLGIAESGRGTCDGEKTPDLAWPGRLLVTRPGSGILGGGGGGISGCGGASWLLGTFVSEMGYMLGFRDATGADTLR